MKRTIPLIVIVMFLISIIGVVSQEVEEGFSVLDGQSANTIWQDSLTSFQKFIIKVNNIISPQTVKGEVENDSSTTSYRIGE